MPLGISESLIQRAYAPVDLSGFYKGIDEASKLAAAEQRAEQKAAQKDYYNSQAIINKDMGGIKSQDMSEVNGHYSKWKSLQRQLMNTSFEKKHEEYARLNAEANVEYGATLSTIELSKQKKKEHDAILTNMMQNPKKYKKDARTVFMGRMLMPTSEAIKINERGVTNDDISDLQYTGPTTEEKIKFNDKLKKEGYSKAHIITFGDETKPYVAGTDIEIADIPSLGKMAKDYLSNFGNESAQLYLDENKNIVKETKQTWDSLPESSFEGIKALDPATGKYVDKYPINSVTGKRKPSLIFDENDPTATFISTISAKGFIDNPIKEGKQFTIFTKGKVGEKQMMTDISTKAKESIMAIQNEYISGRQQDNRNYTTTTLANFKKLQDLDKLEIKTAAGAAGIRIAKYAAENPDATPEQMQNVIQSELKTVENISSGKVNPKPVLPGSPSTLGNYVPPLNTQVPKTKGKISLYKKPK